VNERGLTDLKVLFDKLSEMRDMWETVVNFLHELVVLNIPEVGELMRKYDIKVIDKEVQDDPTRLVADRDIYG